MADTTRVASIQHMLKRRYIPEIHDVAPATEGSLDDLLAALPEEARDIAAILVVPNWRDQEPLADHPQFVSRVSRLPGEKVLHGLTHSLGRDWWNSLFYGTENHAEFASLNKAEALMRLAAGQEQFQRAFGRRADWFCAPRWQQSHETAAALRELGFKGFMAPRGYVRLDGREWKLPAVCFDEGAHAWRRAGGRLHRRWQMNGILSREEPFRFTLHPADLEDRKTWAQVLHYIKALGEGGWKPLAFSDLVG